MWSLLFLLGPALLAAVSHASKTPYDQYILAPSSRNLVPESIYQVNGSVSNADVLTNPGSKNATFNGPASVAFDFGRNIGGIVSLDIASTSSSDAFMGVTFTESSLWVSSEACDATAEAGFDSPLWFPVGQGPGKYTAEKKHTRGAFRYMTVMTNTTASVSVRSVRVKYTAAPTQDLRAYNGYFHSNDELINRIWYAGAYTLQLCTIDPSTGDSLTTTLGEISSTDNITLPETVPWYNNYTISNGSTVLTDGAKRDRLIWPGDMSIGVESAAVSTGDLESVKNALEALFSQQKANGRLPYGGRPFPDKVSFPYHLHSLIGLSDYYRLTGDHTWLSKYWNQYKRGVQWALTSVDQTGLANIAASADWLRSGMGAHNIEANAILYYVLDQAQDLATTLHDQTATNWSNIASSIKTAANQRLWDSDAGLYRDNETTTLYPQDGNAWAIKANLTLSKKQSSQVSSSLQSRWGPYGAPAPEAGKNVSSFISGFELQAHYLAGNTDAALALMRTQWGFMLDDPRMTNSTFIEGYSTDGSLVYAPYNNDPRISHAHGWSAGPTAALTFYTAGLHLTGPAGSTWKFAPQPGNLTDVDAGFSTKLGAFSIKFSRADGEFQRLSFNAPNGTTGDVELAGTKGSLVSREGKRVELVDGKAKALTGGHWELK